MFMLNCGENPQLVSPFTLFLVKILTDEIIGNYGDFFI